MARKQIVHDILECDSCGKLVEDKVESLRNESWYEFKNEESGDIIHACSDTCLLDLAKDFLHVEEL
jgi:hypothetical protein